MSSRTTAPELTCLGLTEQGKIHALAGQHPEALSHYREALRIAMTCAHNEVFFHYVTQCILESLELSGANAEVRDYCVRVEQQFASVAQADRLLSRQRAANLERLGLAWIQLGNPDEARVHLEHATRLAGEKLLPLAAKVSAWLRRGLHVETRQLRLAQKQFGYFVVRPEGIRTDIALKLPRGAGAPAVFA
jgi:tetratricopeptide (TPR) repeat protein